MAKHRSTDPQGSIDRKAGPSGHAVPSDDVAVFRAAVTDVKPLAQSPLPPGLAKPARRARLRKTTWPAADRGVDLDAAMPLLPTRGAADAADSTPGGGEALSYQRAGVRTQVMRRLRRGLYPIEGELDLHGLTQASARDRLAAFLEQHRDAGTRCVRIIHGKGYRSGARGPVLKNAVDLWLRRHFDVMAFTSARALDGGTGAVYVLLRA